ncbi:MAG: thioredoxin family protein [Planctomycetota bacterium]|jgi:thiol-disulfide isomerase/thioredoxin
MKIPKAAFVAIVLVTVAGISLAEEEGPPQTVQSAYPGLVAGVLASASIGDLDEGILLDMGEADITQRQLDEVLDGSPENLQEQLRKNSLLLVQEMATKTLLLQAAREWAEDRQAYPADKTDSEIIGDYLQELVSGVTVSDAELQRFYEENRGMFGGAELEGIRDTLRQFVLKTKRQERVDECIRSLAGRFGVVVSGPWLAEQAVAARDNPVDKARASGKPTLVDFGAEGCRACDMMAPILERLKQEYAGKANIVFVHVQNAQVLAARYGIRSIPVQVFFDREGEEVFRHTGFFARKEIEEKLAELGAR